ncbi:MAG: tetratricopeptide repeat protein [Rhodospirillaceae bacterium]
MTSSDAEALYEAGIACLRSGDVAGARDRFVAALQSDPDHVHAHNGMGLALAALGQDDAALHHYDTAIRIQPEFASPYINRSLILHRRGDVKAALDGLNRAIQLQPDNPTAHNNRGSIFTELMMPREAIASLNQVLAIDPDYPLAAGLRLLNKIYICDWNGFQRDLPMLGDRLDRGEAAAPPWALLPLIDRPDLQRRAAESWAAQNAPASTALGPAPVYPNHERIRIGYYSADFHRHATAHLIAELFERHDRNNFEVFAFSLGTPKGDEMEKRLMAGVDKFVDVSAKSDRDIAQLSRELEIDIAVDLKGLTVGHRMAAFAQRAASIQVNYLGFPGTLGAPYYDYIIADEVIIPQDARRHYTENVIALPGSYQVNDRRRQVSDRVFTRAELGLPESGMVFCCFNNNFKIMPYVFDVWMRILHAVPGSVLWLIEDNPIAAENLRWEAERRGVEKKRIVFAGRIAPEDHLARQKCADLFLDTYPYNAHTTASDALWVGVPLITCPGDTFASRVAASLLTAMDLPELIVPTFNHMEELAVELAKDPARLAALKEKVKKNGTTSTLFDTDDFARKIEGAYQQMIAAQRTKH